MLKKNFNSHPRVISQIRTTTKQPKLTRIRPPIEPLAPDNTEKAIPQFILDIQQAAQQTSRFTNLQTYAENVDPHSCRPHFVDPWDTSVLSRVYNDSLPQAKCDIRWRIRSSLRGGNLMIRRGREPKDGEICEFTCIEFDIRSNSTLRPSGSIVSVRAATCPMAEIKCKRENRITYKNVHMQIIEKPSTADAQPGELKRFGLHVIVLETASMSQIQRSFPQTLHFLRHRLEAVEFPNLNKIGDTTEINFSAFFLGQSTNSGTYLPYGAEKMPAVEESPFCDSKGRRSPSLFAELKRHGYVVMFNEDRKLGLFNERRCPKDAVPPIDHYFGQYFVRKRKMFPKSRANLTAGSTANDFCIENHEDLLSHLRVFTRHYMDQPKASVTWFSALGREYKSDFYRADLNFKRFFLNNEQRLTNSFVFFMSAQGSPFYSSESIPIDRFESKNPFLYVVLPKALRNRGDLSALLKQNSAQLLTHYDIYASFMDVIRNSMSFMEQTNFLKRSTDESKQTRGSSLFRSLSTPRTCHSLGIPLKSCACGVNSMSLNDTQLYSNLSKLTLNLINNEIANSRLLQQNCVSPLELASNASESGIERLLADYPNLNVRSTSEQTYDRILRFYFHTQPGDGLFEGYAKMDRTNSTTLTLEHVRRVNNYRDQSLCVHSHPFCFCKKLLSNNTKNKPS
ncbi:hypothetical protein M3Y96_00560000 [Aphelenchoides besseyi]|nr:hypothetical protein M3Y96_00560000 [Aphelenchoides besseyi]